VIKENTETTSTNRNALISIIAAILTVLSFCTAVAPVPFTGYVCYPAATILGLVALLTGLTSLGQIRDRKEHGRVYALVGAGVGGLTMLAALCATSVGILLFSRILSLFHQYLK